MRFEETKKFGCDASEVWERASAIDQIPTYWHGTRSLEQVSEHGGMVHAKVRFAFGGSGEANISINEEKRVMTIEYVSGPFTGKQTVEVSDGKVTATWDVRFRGAYHLALKWNEGHFRSGTVHALERLTAPRTEAGYPAGRD